MTRTVRAWKPTFPVREVKPALAQVRFHPQPEKPKGEMAATGVPGPGLAGVTAPNTRLTPTHRSNKANEPTETRCN